MSARTIESMFSVLLDIPEVAEYAERRRQSALSKESWRRHWQQFLHMQKFTPAMNMTMGAVGIGWILALLGMFIMMIVSGANIHSEFMRFLLIALFSPVVLAHAAWGIVWWKQESRRSKRIFRYLDRRERNRIRWHAAT